MPRTLVVACAIGMRKTGPLAEVASGVAPALWSEINMAGLHRLLRTATAGSEPLVAGTNRWGEPDQSSADSCG